MYFIDGHQQKFSFTERVSISRLQELRTNIDATVAYMNERCERHMFAMICAQPWICSAREGECRNIAVKFVTTPMSYLHCNPPYIQVAITTPICHDPKCNVVAHLESQKIMKEVSKEREEAGKAGGPDGSSLYSNKVRQCGHCKRTEKGGSNLLRCGRCQIVHYCNKDCQKAHWETHKRFCAKGKVSK